MAEVIMNGKSVGYVWCTPYKVSLDQVLRPGTNTICISVSNGLNNRQVGDAIEKHERPYTHSNIDRGNCAWCDPWEKVPLRPSGLLKIPVLVLEK